MPSHTMIERFIFESLKTFLDAVVTDNKFTQNLGLDYHVRVYFKCLTGIDWWCQNTSNTLLYGHIHIFTHTQRHTEKHRHRDKHPKSMNIHTHPSFSLGSSLSYFSAVRSVMTLLPLFLCCCCCCYYYNYLIIFAFLLVSIINFAIVLFDVLHC